LDKKQRQFDKALSDAKSKQEDAQIALEAAIKETRMAEVESAKVLTAWAYHQIRDGDVRRALKVTIFYLVERRP